VLARRYQRQTSGRVTCAVVNGPATDGILERARATAADLIALATHGRGNLKRLLLGSVADKVLRGAEVPLLLSRLRQMTGTRRPSRSAFHDLPA
jgi:nucleotide-binding universal stress UspA family protein